MKTKTLRTKQAVKMLQDIFKLDISKQEKADKVREFIQTHSYEVFERVCNKYFDEAFPDWFEDFVAYEWKPKPPLKEPQDWRNKENSAWIQK